MAPDQTDGPGGNRNVHVGGNGGGPVVVGDSTTNQSGNVNVSQSQIEQIEQLIGQQININVYGSTIAPGQLLQLLMILAPITCPRAALLPTLWAALPPAADPPRLDHSVTMACYVASLGQQPLFTFVSHLLAVPELAAATSQLRQWLAQAGHAGSQPHAARPAAGHPAQRCADRQALRAQRLAGGPRAGPAPLRRPRAKAAGDAHPPGPAAAGLRAAASGRGAREAARVLHAEQRLSGPLVYATLPAAGPVALSGPADAVALADHARTIIAEHRRHGRRTHLVIYGPKSFAIFLGQRLSALGEIVTYEFSTTGYIPSITYSTGPAPGRAVPA